MSKKKIPATGEKKSPVRLIKGLLALVLLALPVMLLDVRLPFVVPPGPNAPAPVKGMPDIILRLPPFIPQVLPRRGTMFLAQGKAAFQRKDKSWYTLSSSAPLNVLDAITTKDDGQVAFEQFDGLTGFLDKNAIIKINEGQNPQVWSLNQGRVLLNPKKALWVETPQAVVEIGENAVVYLLTDEQKTLVSVGFGQALVRDILKQGGQQTVNIGQKSVVPRNGVPAPPIADNRLPEISLLAARSVQTLAADNTLKKMLARKLGRTPQVVTDLIAVPAAAPVPASPSAPVAKAKPVPGTPPPKPSAPDPQALINEENRLLKSLEHIRRVYGQWAFEHPGEVYDLKKHGNLGINLPEHALSGVKSRIAHFSCPATCPGKTDSAWLICSNNGVVQVKINDRDQKGRQLCNF